MGFPESAPLNGPEGRIRDVQNVNRARLRSRPVLKSIDSNLLFGNRQHLVQLGTRPFHSPGAD